jgi:hypothetical protein
MTSEFPTWWNQNGFYVSGIELDIDNLTLIFSSTVAKLTITRAPHVNPEDWKGWFVDWEVVYNFPQKTGVKGRTDFNSRHLKGAFNFLNETEHEKQLVNKYQCDSVSKGRYIRFRDCLNIPGPGTGLNYDANFSMTLTKEIRNAVAQLLMAVGEL